MNDTPNDLSIEENVPHRPEAPMDAPNPEALLDDAPPASVQAGHHEASTALRSGLKLATSLTLTWGIALIIAFKLPKYLGPSFLGYYRYGEQFAMTLAVFLGFGVDTYISREVAVRPKHASDFFGGVVLVRLLAVVPLAVYAVVALRDKLPEERIAVTLFAVAQLFIVLNATFQQMLQAASQVGGLAIANVVSKILWGGGILLAVTLRVPFWVLPSTMIVSEAMKAAFLYRATRQAIDLRLRFDLGETKRVLRAAFPFFIANAAVTLGSTIDVVVLRALVPPDSREVGWYSAASMIARLSALMSPVLSGVLVPMMSRAKHRNEEEFFKILRRGLEGVSIVSIPLTLILALSADFVIRLALKEPFAPAALSLQWLAPTFVLAYANVLLWIALMILDRSWTITIISFVGLALLPAFILGVVPLTRGMGDGATGMGVAMALSARELVIVVIFFACLGKKAVDQRSVLSITKSLGICCAVVAVHVGLASFGNIRLAADCLAYLVLALVTRVLRPGDIKDVLMMIKNRRQIQAEANG